MSDTLDRENFQTEQLNRIQALGGIDDVEDFIWWLSHKRLPPTDNYPEGEPIHLEWLQRGEYDQYGWTWQNAVLLYIMEDPVRWVSTFMEEPDSPGTPYQFFDYQRESIRAWHQNVIHKDGAEVGKTREIVALCVWGPCTGFGGKFNRANMLVGAPQKTHLDEIINDLEVHFGVDQAATKKPLIQRYWLKPSKSPHYQANFRAPGGQGASWIKFRPAGEDGEAFRGVHANAMGVFDEAAKAHKELIMSEFYRGLMPEATSRLYSVPDGRNDTHFYRKSKEAIPNLAVGVEGVRLFHWPKTLMPAPFWDDKRKREFIRRFGSETAPGYVRNVQGDHGQAENPVFPEHELMPNVQDVPDYRVLKLLVDHGEQTLSIHASKIVYQTRPTEAGKLHQHGEVHTLIERDEPLSHYQAEGDAREHDDPLRDAFRALISETFRNLGPGVYWAGADLGYSKDPTEIMLWREVGQQLIKVARIHTTGLGYDGQCEVIHALDALYEHSPMLNWGVDFGSAGTAVVQMMQGLGIYADGAYDQRMAGFQFASALERVDEDGNLLETEDKDGNFKVVKLPAKQLATELMTAKLQARGYLQPYDPETVGHYQNHTARQGQRNLIYDKSNDHTIDADRAAMLARVFHELTGGTDVFRGGFVERAA